MIGNVESGTGRGPNNGPRGLRNGRAPRAARRFGARLHALPRPDRGVGDASVAAALASRSDSRSRVPGALKPGVGRMGKFFDLGNGPTKSAGADEGAVSK